MTLIAKRGQRAALHPLQPAATLPPTVMDLMTCRQCGMDVAASATTCPNCGVVDPGGGGRISSPAALAILGIVGVLFVLIMTTDLGPAVAK